MQDYKTLGQLGTQRVDLMEAIREASDSLQVLEKSRKQEVQNEQHGMSPVAIRDQIPKPQPPALKPAAN